MADQAKIVDQGWQLKRLNIEKAAAWQSQAHDYVGKMVFFNNRADEINFNIPPERMDQLLSVISECVIDSAKEMSNRLIKSLAPPEKLIENNPPE